MPANNHVIARMTAGAQLAIRLVWAPFAGVAHALRREIRRPAHSWQEVARNDVLLYFAPLVGAIDSVRHVWRTRHQRHSSSQQQ